MKHLFIPLTLTALLVFAGTALAQNRGSIELTATTTQAKTITDSNGHEKTVMVPAGRVVPGTVVTYTITYHNISQQPVGEVVVHDPVPAHMNYVAGSAQGADTTIDYSADGGKTWAASLAKLIIKNADGSTRTATAADVTTLRWSVNGEVAPGKSGSVSFRAILQ